MPFLVRLLTAHRCDPEQTGFLFLPVEHEDMFIRVILERAYAGAAADSSLWDVIVSSAGKYQRVVLLPFNM